MNIQQQGFSAVTSLIIIAIIGVIGVAGDYVWMHRHTTSSLSASHNSTPIVNQSSSPATAHVAQQTYAVAGSYSFSYPADWQYKITPFSDANVLTNQGQGDISLSPSSMTSLTSKTSLSGVVQVGLGTFNATTANFQAYEQTLKSQFSDATFTNMVINGNQALAMYTNNTTYTNYTTFITHGNKVVAIGFQEKQSTPGAPSYTWDYSQYLPQYKAIVQSLKM
ncbi:MAG TPA: hypothetical protein VFN56_04005 [Candidatus Saccharimonadales bacterium]|nr:hypothetical protein [Candidatus Saccharimonadales bacterium]